MPGGRWVTGSCQCASRRVVALGDIKGWSPGHVQDTVPRDNGHDRRLFPRCQCGLAMEVLAGVLVWRSLAGRSVAQRGAAWRSVAGRSVVAVARHDSRWIAE